MKPGIRLTSLLNEYSLKKTIILTVMYITVNYLHHRELQLISVDMVMNLLPGTRPVCYR